MCTFIYCIAQSVRDIDVIQNQDQINCVTFIVSLSSLHSLSDSDTQTHSLGWKMGENQKDVSNISPTLQESQNKKIT